MAIFSASPRVWKRSMPGPEDISEFFRQRNETGIEPIVLHSLYLVNLASPNPTDLSRSLDALEFELEFAEALGIDWVVLHPGSHCGTGEKRGIERCALSLNELFSRSRSYRAGIALETVAGSGDSIGGRFEHLRDIIAQVDYQDRVSICIDTCHLFAAGYDIRTAKGWAKTSRQMDSLFGLSKIVAVHLNDSKTALSSGVDRHTHIGEGEIGPTGFRAIVNDRRLAAVPMILETPKGSDYEFDKKNLRVLKALRGDKP